MSSPLRRLLVSLFGAVTVAVAILTVFGFLGGWWWIFDLFAHFRVQYLVVALFGLVLLASLRAWRLSAIALAALVSNLVLVVPLFVDRPARAVEGSPLLTVLSFNVTASNPDRGAVLAFLEDSDADIVFLYESSTDWEDEIRRADLPYRMVSARRPGSVFGTTALVRAGQEARILVLGDFGQWSIEVVASVAGEPVKVLGTHPLSPISRARTSARDEQLRLVGEWARRQEVPVVVVGDLNASTWSRGFTRLVAAADLVNSQRGYGVQASWPVDHPLLAIPIDHMVHSRELTTVDRRLGESLGSDHASLHVTVGMAR